MKYLNIYLGLLLSSLLITSCSDHSSPVDSGKPNADNSSKYIIAATPTALEDVADYLLTADSLSGGSISTLGSGIEQDGTWRYYVTDHAQSKFFSFLYSSSGAVTTYQLNDSRELEEIADFQSSIVHAFTPVKDDILSIQIPRNGDPTAHWYRLDTESVQFVDEGQINTEELAPGNEWAYFSWLTQVGDHVFAPFFSIRACCNDVFGTQYPDSAWVAVYNYPSMERETIIKDDRTSFIGRYFTKGLSVDENGDVYAFSSALADMNDEFISTKPSAITRINEGELQFDQDYFFNIEEASGGYYLTNHIYASNGNVLLLMRDTDEKAPYAEGHRLAIANVYDKSFTWVSGMPEASDILDIMDRNYFVSEDGSTAAVGITTEEGNYIYNIDVATATATKGLHVEGGKVTAIHKLNTPE